VRQVLLWLQQEALPLPSLQHGPEGRTVVWKLPVYASVRHILTNPVYVFSEVMLDSTRNRLSKAARASS
jgi:hypothetical protein